MERNAKFTSGETLKNRAVLGQRIVEFGLIGLIIFSPLPAASVHDWSIFVIQLTVLVLMVGYFLTAEKEGPDRPGKYTLKWPNYLFFGFWAFVLFQCVPLPKFLTKILSPGTNAFLEQFVPDFPSMKFISLSLAPSISLKSGLALLPFFLIGYLIVKTIKTRPQIIRIFSILFIMGIFEAAYGLFEYFSGMNFVSGTFVNRNHFAGYLGMMIPLGLGLILAQEHSKKKTIIGLLLSLGVIVMSLALILSRSRSGTFILVFIFMLFFSLSFFYSRKRKNQYKREKVLLISIFTIIVILSLSIGFDTTLQRFSLDYLLRESRPDIWSHALEIIGDFPVFGSGLGTFAVLYPVMEADGKIFIVSHAHNDYLEYLSEMGITGMSLLLGGVIFIFMWCLLKWMKREDPMLRGLGLGGVVAVLALSVHGLTDFNLHIPSNILLFSVVLSLMYVTVSHHSTKVG